MHKLRDLRLTTNFRSHISRALTLMDRNNACNLSSNSVVSVSVHSYSRPTAMTYLPFRAPFLTSRVVRIDQHTVAALLVLLTGDQPYSTIESESAPYAAVRRHTTLGPGLSTRDVTRSV